MTPKTDTPPVAANASPTGAPVRRIPTGGNKEPQRPQNALTWEDRSRGGKKASEAARVRNTLGVQALSEVYKRAAIHWRRSVSAELSRLYGGTGATARALLHSAAVAWGWSKYYADQAGDDATALATSTRLAADARAQVMAAHEVSRRARDAVAVAPAKTAVLDSILSGKLQ